MAHKVAAAMPFWKRTNPKDLNAHSRELDRLWRDEDQRMEARLDQLRREIRDLPDVVDLLAEGSSNGHFL